MVYRLSAMVTGYWGSSRFLGCWIIVITVSSPTTTITRNNSAYVKDICYFYLIFCNFFVNTLPEVGVLKHHTRKNKRKRKNNKIRKLWVWNTNIKNNLKVLIFLFKKLDILNEFLQQNHNFH